MTSWNDFLKHTHIFRTMLLFREVLITGDCHRQTNIVLVFLCRNPLKNQNYVQPLQVPAISINSSGNILLRTRFFAKTRRPAFGACAHDIVISSSLDSHLANTRLTQLTNSTRFARRSNLCYPKAFTNYGKQTAFLQAYNYGLQNQ